MSRSFLRQIASSAVRTAGPGDARLLIHLDDVLLRLSRVLLQIAYRRGVGRLALRESLNKNRLLVLHLGEMHVENRMMGLGIEGDGSAGRIDTDAALERLDHLFPINAACFFDSSSPEQHSLIARHRQIRDGWIVGSKFCAEPL